MKEGREERERKRGGEERGKEDRKEGAEEGKEKKRKPEKGLEDRARKREKAKKKKNEKPTESKQEPERADLFPGPHHPRHVHISRDADDEEDVRDDEEDEAAGDGLLADQQRDDPGER